MYNFLEVLEQAIHMLEQELHNFHAEEDDEIEIDEPYSCPDDVYLLASRIGLEKEIKYIDIGLTNIRGQRKRIERKKHINFLLQCLEDNKNNDLVKKYNELSEHWAGIFNLDGGSKDFTWGVPQDLVSEIVKSIPKGPMDY